MEDGKSKWQLLLLAILKRIINLKKQKKYETEKFFPSFG